MLHRLRFLTYLLLVSLLLIPLSASAQRDSKFSDRLESARKLYYSGAYYAAEEAFDALNYDIDADELSKAEIEAYRVLCAIAMDRENIDGLVKVFFDNYPSAPQQAMVKFALGCHYFDRGRYDKALELFGALRKNHIYRTQRTEFEFKKAFCNMVEGDKDDAAESFASIVRSLKKSQYTLPSTYYLGYIDYTDKKFDEAIPLFSKCLDDSRFSLMSSYYLVECRFMLSDYRYVTKEGPAVLAKADNELKPNLARMISEAYYELGDTGNAKDYLDIFTGSGAKMSRKDFYYSGILMYNLGAYQQAVESFSKVKGVRDSLAQNAAYYSANSYLETRNKIAAMESFAEAASMDFDKVIREDAMFNHAKLAFDVNSDITKFADYMDAYPRSGKEDVINNYMAMSYILSKDYRSAVDVLRKIRNHTPESSSNLQKAAFLRGMQLVENGSWRNAIEMFDLSNRHKQNNASLANLANYWLSESYFRDERYNEAKMIVRQLISSEQFRSTPEYPMALYNLAYDYLKAGEYQGAREYFEEFLKERFRDKSYDADAKVRRADTYFLENNYAEAAKAYDEIASTDFTSDDVYPAFQSAVSYGLLGNEAKKISLLNSVVRNNRTSDLYPQALYELGRAYVQKGDGVSATDCFYKLQSESYGIYYTKALLELAMLNSNASKYEKALSYYKAVIRTAPHSEEAQDALLGIESIYQVLNQPEEYLEYLEDVGLDNIKSTGEKEEMFFSSAEQLYLAQKYSSAIPALQTYLAKFPDGARSSQASYYLAESLRATGRLEAAIDVYGRVMKNGGRYSDDAAKSYADLSLDLEHYSKAVNAYESMVSSAKTDQERLDGHVGRMRAYYRNRQYVNAIKDARYIIDVASSDEALLREARYVLAKSSLMTGDRTTARSLFKRLSENTSDAYGAESAYVLITDAYDSGDFNQVETLVYAFSDSGSSQVYWLAKSFIVLGDSFADREEWAQAKATFQSILDGYKPQRDDDDVKEQVTMRLNRIKEMGK